MMMLMNIENIRTLSRRCCAPPFPRCCLPFELLPAAGELTDDDDDKAVFQAAVASAAIAISDLYWPDFAACVRGAAAAARGGLGR